MTSLRASITADRLTKFLTRFQPPQGIRDNTEAMQAETDALLKALLRYAPTEAPGDWVDGALERCNRDMKTRAWPTVYEIEQACQATVREAGAAPSDAVETAMLAHLISWHKKFGTQLPGCGSPARTAALIARGVLRDEADARRKGFDLAPAAARRAAEQEN